MAVGTSRERVVFALYWAIVVPLYLIVAFLFWRKRDKQPIKARSPYLLLASAFAGFVLLTYMACRSLFDAQIPCPTTYWLGCFLFVLYILPYLLRCYRLMKVFDFNVAKAGISKLNFGSTFLSFGGGNRASGYLQQDSDPSTPHRLSFEAGIAEQNIKDTTFQDIIDKRGNFTERRLLKILLVIMAALVGILAVIHGALSQNLLKGGTPTCENSERWVLEGLIALMVMLVVIFILLIFKMRYVTDVFSINDELKEVCVVASVHIIVVLCLQSNEKYYWPAEPYLGYVTASLVILCVCISVVQPLVRAYILERRSSRFEHKGPDTSNAFSDNFGKQNRPLKQTLTFEILLENAGYRQYFQQFLINELSVENILFWLEVQDFKKLTDPAQILSTAKIIYNKYIASDSPFQLNIGHKLADQTGVQLSRADIKLFDKAEEEVLLLMKTDSFPRFLESSMFESMDRNVNQSQKVVDAAASADLI